MVEKKTGGVSSPWYGSGLRKEITSLLRFDFLPLQYYPQKGRSMTRRRVVVDLKAGSVVVIP